MRFCFSTFSSALICGARASRVQRVLCSALLASVPPYSDIGHSDTVMAYYRHGERNIPLEKDPPPEKWDIHEIHEKICEKVIPLMDGSKSELVVLALQDIVASDSAIANDAVVELLNGITKEAFIRRKQFVLSELLTGLLVYVLRFTSNKGTGADSSQITNDYVMSFAPKKFEITFVQSYADLRTLSSKDMPLTGDDAVLLAESGARCLLCGRPVGIREGTLPINRAKFVTLPDGTRIVTCADCASKVNAMAPEAIERLGDVQREQAAITQAEDMIAADRLTGEIEIILREVDTLEDAQSTQLRHDPVCVEEKVAGVRLRGRILSDVLRLYDEIDDAFDRLAGVSATNAERLGKQINRMYEDALEKGLPEYDIYQTISNRLNAHTGRKYPEACNAIVSYYVQRCDVFRAPAQ